MWDENLLRRYGRYLVLSAVVSIFIVTMSGEGYSIFIHLPTISISPNPAAVDQYITITGQYFTSNSRAYIYIDSQENGGTSISSTGNFSYSWELDLTPGTYQVYAIDGNGLKSPVVTLTVNPAPTATPIPGPQLTVSVSPNPAMVGQTVTISGKSIGSWESISYNGRILDSSVATQFDGSYSYQFTPMANDTGTNTIDVTTGVGMIDVNTSLTVNAVTKSTPTPAPSIGTHTATPSPTNNNPTATSGTQAQAATPTPGTGNSNSAISDSVAPVTTMNLTGTADSNGGFASDVICTLTASDNAGGSGVNAIQYCFDGATWYVYTKPFSVVKQGTTTVYYRSTDNAGNTEVANVKAIVISAVPPSSASTAKPSPSASMGLTVVSLIGMAAMLQYTRRNGKN